MKELRKEMLKIIVEVGGVDNILNKHKNELRKKYDLTDIDNTLDYFTFSKQGQARVLKALSN
jgi:transcriptional accessory protein Tex/SPT6